MAKFLFCLISSAAIRSGTWLLKQSAPFPKGLWPLPADFFIPIVLKTSLNSSILLYLVPSIWSVVICSALFCFSLVQHDHIISVEGILHMSQYLTLSYVFYILLYSYSPALSFLYGHVFSLQTSFQLFWAHSFLPTSKFSDTISDNFRCASGISRNFSLQGCKKGTIVWVSLYVTLPSVTMCLVQ